MLSRRGSDRHTFTCHAPIASLLLLPSPVIFPPVASSPLTRLRSLEAGCYLKHGSTIVYLPSHFALSAAAFGTQLLQLLNGFFQAFGFKLSTGVIPLVKDKFFL